MKIKFLRIKEVSCRMFGIENARFSFIVYLQGKECHYRKLFCSIFDDFYSISYIIILIYITEADHKMFSHEYRKCIFYNSFTRTEKNPLSYGVRLKFVSGIYFNDATIIEKYPNHSNP